MRVNGRMEGYMNEVITLTTGILILIMIGVLLRKLMNYIGKHISSYFITMIQYTKDTIWGRKNVK